MDVEQVEVEVEPDAARRDVVAVRKEAAVAAADAAAEVLMEQRSRADIAEARAEAVQGERDRLLAERDALHAERDELRDALRAPKDRE